MSNQYRAPDELIAASEHVLCEVHMLQGMASGIASGMTLGSPLHNALTESFVVHARNLLHFLFPERPHDTDILAEHFFDEPERWYSLRGTMPADLKAVRVRANKQMARIAYDRLEAVGEERRWEYLGILYVIVALVELFAQNAKSDLLHPNWVKISPPAEDQAKG